jgi:hypothetical protein
MTTKTAKTLPVSKRVAEILSGKMKYSETGHEREFYLDNLRSWREDGIVIEESRDPKTYNTSWDIHFTTVDAFNFLKGSRTRDSITVKFYADYIGTNEVLDTLHTLLHKDLKAIIGKAQVSIDIYAHRNSLIEIVFTGTRNALHTIGIHLFTNSAKSRVFISPLVDDYLSEISAWYEHGGYQGYLEDCGLDDTKEHRKEFNAAMLKFGWTDAIIPLRGEPLDKTERKYRESEAA